MDDPEYIECWHDPARGLYISKRFPNRAAKRVLLGFALYAKYEGEPAGERIGIADERNTFKWLGGVPIEDVETLNVNWS